MSKYDAIVIGAGHNGLVNAAYLARAGKSVLVLEKRDLVGGATVTEEVVADAETLEEAVEAATQAGRPNHLIWYHHVLPRDTVIVGGL